MNDPITIIEAETPAHFAMVRNLLLTYAEVRNYDKALGDYQKEMKDLPGMYASPKGCLLLAISNKNGAGMVAFRQLTHTTCEMKRLFVLEQFKGQGIGPTLVTKLLQVGAERAYTKMFLDTHPWMKQAESMYRKFGFTPIDPYNDNPTPGIKHFMRMLNTGDAL